MKQLILEPTEDTPAIDFNFESKELKISGRSLPEDVNTFYQPILDWLDELEKIAEGEFIFRANLEYFNTASSKLILDILMKLEDIHTDSDATFKIIWEFDPDDEDMEEAAEEYSELVEVPFEIVPFEQ